MHKTTHIHIINNNKKGFRPVLQYHKKKKKEEKEKVKEEEQPEGREE